METYNVNYRYTTYLAFLLNMRYNNSRKMTITSLKRYPEYLLLELNLLSDDKFNITMINDCNDFDNCINDSSIFTIEEKYIKLNDNIHIDYLLKELYSQNYPFTDLAINTIKSSNLIKKTLKLNKIEKCLDSLNNIEKLIEATHTINIFNKDSLINLYKIRDDYYRKLIKFGSTAIMDFEDESLFMLNDPYIDSFPIDSTNNYDMLFEDGEREIYNILLNPYLVAYFTSEELSRNRINEDLSNISLKHCCFGDYTNNKEFIDEVEYDAKENGSYAFRSKIELLFMLTLIKELDNYIKTEDDQIFYLLNWTQNRLIYLLDNQSLNLTNYKCFSNLYNKLWDEYNKTGFNDDIFEIESFEIIKDYGKLAKTLIYDLFEGIYDKELIIKKLAFIKTYYNITNDKEIISIFSKYSDNDNFWNYLSQVKNNNIKLEKKLNR